jgi:ribonuclease E
MSKEEIAAKSAGLEARREESRARRAALAGVPREAEPADEQDEARPDDAVEHAALVGEAEPAKSLAPAASVERPAAPVGEIRPAPSSPQLEAARGSGRRPGH